MRFVPVPLLRSPHWSERILIPTDEFFPDGVDAGAYAMISSGDCISPHASDGDLVVISPAALLEPRRFVAFLHEGEDGMIAMRCKMLLGIDDDAITVAMLNPPQKFVTPRAQILKIHTIIGFASPDEFQQWPRFSKMFVARFHRQGPRESVAA